ncbi:unnamed protein product, partial [Brachionus calyciflorus]
NHGCPGGRGGFSGVFSGGFGYHTPRNNSSKRNRSVNESGTESENDSVSTKRHQQPNNNNININNNNNNNNIQTGNIDASNTNQIINHENC